MGTLAIPGQAQKMRSRMMRGVGGQQLGQWRARSLAWRPGLAGMLQPPPCTLHCSPHNCAPAARALAPELMRCQARCCVAVS